jgi:hypothetical protein
VFVNALMVAEWAFHQRFPAFNFLKIISSHTSLIYNLSNLA